MRRLRYFWSGLPSTSKLQFFVLALILGSAFISNDLNPKFKAFGFKLWQVTVPMICGTILMGRLLMPVMMWNPSRAERMLSGFGLLVFALWIYSSIQKAQVVGIYLSAIGALWLDASCWFWFISEIRLRDAAWQNQFEHAAIETPTENDDEETDE
jgi:hypothetical protein